VGLQPILDSNWVRGRPSAFQAEGRGFEPRLPLQKVFEKELRVPEVFAPSTGEPGP